jgi:hypothetical protein
MFGMGASWNCSMGLVSAGGRFWTWEGAVRQLESVLLSVGRSARTTTGAAGDGWARASLPLSLGLGFFLETGPEQIVGWVGEAEIVGEEAEGGLDEVIVGLGAAEFVI